MRYKLYLEIKLITKMITKLDLQSYILEALNILGGKSTIVEICKIVWQKHEQDLKNSGDLFYTWQYDIRWAAQKLRDEKQLKPIINKNEGIWELM